jgi:hypothetical protein
VKAERISRREEKLGIEGSAQPSREQAERTRESERAGGKLSATFERILKKEKKCGCQWNGE